MARIGKLNIEIGASNKTGKGLRSAGRDISRFAKSVGGMAFTGVATGIASITAAAGAAGGAIGHLTMKSIDAIGDANDFAKSIGASYTELRKLQKAAQLSGVDLATTNVALMKMSDVLGSAFGGNKAAIESFDKIGVSVDGLKRMRPEQQFLAIGEAINRIKDPSEKIAAARDIFGRSGGSLISFFANARNDINEAGIALDRFGISLAQADVEKIDAAGDAFGEWKFIVEGIGNQLAKHFAPLILDASDRLVKMIDDAGGVGSAVGHAFDWGIEKASGFLDAIESVQKGWYDLKSVMQDGAGIVASGIAWLEEKTGITALAKKMEEDRRLEMIAPEKREEFKRRLDESGGFQRDGVTTQSIADEYKTDRDKSDESWNAIDRRQREKGTLGDRFKAWEQQAQLRSTADAAGKLANVSEERLDAEEKITKELKAQKGIAEGGQGKFALMAFNGAGSRVAGGGKGKQEIDHGGTEARRGGESAGAMAVAASSEGERSGIYPAVAYQPLPKAAPQAGRERDPDLPKYMDKIPDGPSNYFNKIPDGTNKYESKTPGMRRGYMDKMSPGMEAAMGGDPVAKNLGKAEAKQDKMIALLERIAGNTKSPTLGLA